MPSPISPRPSRPTLHSPRRNLLLRSLAVRPGRPAGHRTGTGAWPVRAVRPAPDTVGIGSEAGIGRRIAAHPAKLPSYSSLVSPAPPFSVGRTICSTDPLSALRMWTNTQRGGTAPPDRPNGCHPSAP
jgi:hypothetical protein